MVIFQLFLWCFEWINLCDEPLLIFTNVITAFFFNIIDIIFATFDCDEAVFTPYEVLCQKLAGLCGGVSCNLSLNKTHRMATCGVICCIASVSDHRDAWLAAAARRRLRWLKSWARPIFRHQIRLRQSPRQMSQQQLSWTRRNVIDNKQTTLPVAVLHVVWTQLVVFIWCQVMFCGTTWSCHWCSGTLVPYF